MAVLVGNQRSLMGMETEKRANHSGELLCHEEGRELPALAPNLVFRTRFCRRLYSF